MSALSIAACGLMVAGTALAGTHLKSPRAMGRATWAKQGSFTISFKSGIVTPKHPALEGAVVSRESATGRVSSLTLSGITVASRAVCSLPPYAYAALSDWGVRVGSVVRLSCTAYAHGGETAEITGTNSFDRYVITRAVHRTFYV